MQSDLKDIAIELCERPLQKNTRRAVAGDGQSQAFGVVNRRSLPPDYSRWCWRRPALYEKLLEFGRKHVSIMWNSITVNQNYGTGPHRDRGNLGDSLVVSFGEFTGGELIIFEGEYEGIHDICYKPIITDFSKVLHAVCPFEGNRLSLVYYYTPTRTVLPEPSVRTVQGVKFFFRGDVVCYSLPHFNSKVFYADNIKDASQKEEAGGEEEGCVVGRQELCGHP